mmetsp:Transcript_9811/g.9476  ORF Transcript_9811/g.9476 Transcript_9811/m.9476 type:complete len:455 (-) Transcript_9811:96-1460(-)
MKDFLGICLCALVMNSSAFVPYSGHFKHVEIGNKILGRNLRLFSSSTDTVPSDVEEDDKKRPFVGTSTSSEVGMGKWEEQDGNYILRPPDGMEPQALIHFLGGAMVGSSPDFTYRYLLERLSERGYLIVATSFSTRFDYLTVCDQVISRFERVAPSLARQYGAVPVIGVGHSLGALLHLLVTCLFPDTPRAANVLISYNNKSVQESVPFLDEIFAPLFTAAAADPTSEEGKKDVILPNPFPRSGIDIIKLTLRLARTVAKGEVPSDAFLQELIESLTPNGLPKIPLSEVPFREQLEDNGIQSFLKESGTATLLEQLFDIIDQVPPLMEDVAGGTRDFTPAEDSIRSSARRAYRARRTLLIQYDNDGLDESEDLEKLLNEASETVMRMKRPMIQVDIQRKVLPGGHATPLLAPPVDIANKAEDWLGEDTAKSKLSYSGADATVEEITRWLDEGFS